MKNLKNCYDCDVKAGEPHVDGCDIERCSACGTQRLGCECSDHDPLFARWTGFWPGDLESKELGIDINEFYEQGYYKVFLQKPSVKG